jgi:hypothetical protein
MQLKSLLSPTLAGSTLLVSFGGVVLAAILTQYPGFIEVNVGEHGLQVRVDGRSISQHLPSLPPGGSQ